MGAFLVSVQTQYPDATLEGFDISSELFPAQDTLPSKISLGVLDMKQPFPIEMHGKYDLVHVRMLVTAMLPDEWDRTVRNLAGLLKPGGFLQWEECEFVNAEYLLQKPGGRYEKTAFIGNQFRGALWERLEKGWNTLPQDMSNAGLTSVISDVFPSDKVPETRSRMTASILSLVFTWARMMAERGVPKSLSDDALNKLQEEVAEEINSGAYLKFNIHVACGQKPLQ